MAGSFGHIVKGRALEFRGVELIENLGDAHEALEECYDMILHLSGGDLHKIHEAQVAGCVKRYPHTNPADPIHSFERFLANLDDDEKEDDDDE